MKVEIMKVEGWKEVSEWEDEGREGGKDIIRGRE